MKKILSLIMMTMLIFSGLLTFNVASAETNQEKIVFNFSNLKIQENDGCIDLEINGADSQLFKNNHYIIPEKL